MAFLATIPAWVGVASAAVSAAAGIYSAAQQKRAGALMENNIKVQARSEADAATQREIDRRKDLLRALSSQNASAGASGIETGGSFGGIVRRNIAENQNDLLISNANTQVRQRALASQASNAVEQGNAAAATSLMDTIGKTYKSIPGRS